MVNLANLDGEPLVRLALPLLRPVPLSHVVFELQSKQNQNQLLIVTLIIKRLLIKYGLLMTHV